MAESEGRKAAGWGVRVGAGFIILVGLPLLIGGAQLGLLHGSHYYLVAGLGLVVAGVQLIRGKASGGVIFALVLLGTLAWAVWESGLAFWPLVPRVFSPLVIGVVALLTMLGLEKSGQRTWALRLTAVGVVLAAALLGVALARTGTQGQARTAAAAAPMALAGQPGDWRNYGRDLGGNRFAPFDQINGKTVKNLKVAWTARTGDVAKGGSEDQNTPSQIGDTVYICTPRNIVIAVDADTGKERWRHDPGVKPFFWNRCRGVGYYERAAAPVYLGGISPPPAICDKRIISTTIDARMFALDARTGQRCPGFGVGGVVDLKAGMGPVKRGFYFQTSAPTVANDRVIVGGWVMDNRELGEPSGAVRAFSAETGELVWAWDLGDPTIDKLPPPGKTYTRGTPNVWSTPAVDTALGLVYLPTGNATPDYWGSHRSDASDRYSSSVVALDIATGKERWHFQTTHHDLWDYDVPSQPMLMDFPTGGGAKVPALIQLTKRGQIFVLDRATGAPLTQVVEKPVPGGAEKGEWTSPTQPYSTGMPTIGAEKLTESQMWGATPIDQLFCRIAFKKARYLGDFTPPGVTTSIQYPANGGGQNWGSGTFDPARGLLIVPDVRIAMSLKLVPTKDKRMDLALVPGRSAKGHDAQSYQSKNGWMLSLLMVPCLQPPNGTLSAIDVATRKVVWEVPAGTAEYAGPFGLKSGLKIPLGTTGLGGPVATAGGLTFHASTQDPYLRAYDSGTGKVVWQAKLPVGVGGTPMTYVSPTSGRQYVVVSAGGARGNKERGDYVMAFALPK
jgi:quinate dehydrogenase (quinone)